MIDWFDSEIILPAQFFTKSRLDLNPEQKLYLAILIDALECARNGKNTPEARKLRAEAQRWILTEGVTAGITVEQVCDALDIEVDYLRRLLKQWLRLAAMGKVRRRAYAYQRRDSGKRDLEMTVTGPRGGTVRKRRHARRVA